MRALDHQEHYAFGLLQRTTDYTPNELTEILRLSVELSNESLVSLYIILLNIGANIRDEMWGEPNILDDFDIVREHIDFLAATNQLNAVVSICVPPEPELDTYSKLHLFLSPKDFVNKVRLFWVIWGKCLWVLYLLLASACLCIFLWALIIILLSLV
jgi:hypothetical protein